MSEVKDSLPKPGVKVDVEKGKEPYTDNKLKVVEDKLDPKQRSLYEDLLMKRRIELQKKDPSLRNVPVEERWGLLEGIKNGEIPTGDKNPLPNVDWEKVRRDFENRWPTFIEKSIPTGDL